MVDRSDEKTTKTPRHRNDLEVVAWASPHRDAAIHLSRVYAQFEERSIFPVLERVLPPETLTELGATWERRRAPAVHPI